MRSAKLGRHGPLVEASESRPRRGYVCPQCGARVMLRLGPVREAHFAHLIGEGSASCEDYHQGTAGSSGNGTSVHRSEDSGEDAAGELSLVAELDGSLWSLSLRIPSLSRSELRSTSLESLRSGRLIILAGGRELRQLSALELLPGTDAAHVRVRPGSQLYHTEAAGRWPEPVVPARWALKTPGLEPRGSLFRLRHGLWRRCPPSSSVQRGERLLFVADPRRPPPASCAPAVCEQRPPETSGWCLWQVSLPLSADPVVNAWLRELGHRAEPPAWELSLLSVPTKQGGAQVQQLSCGEPLLAQLSPPPGQEGAVLALTLGAASAQLALPGASEAPRIFVRFCGPEPGLATLRIVSPRPVERELELSAVSSLDQLRHELDDLPRLRLRIGTDCIEAWTGARHEFQQLNGPLEVELDTGEAESSVELVIQASTGRRCWSSISAEHAEGVIESALSDPSTESVEVDAGALGRIHIVVSAPPALSRPEIAGAPEAGSHAAAERRSGWLSLLSGVAAGLRLRSRASQASAEGARGPSYPLAAEGLPAATAAASQLRSLRRRGTRRTQE